MKDFAKKYLDWYNGLDKNVRVLLCILWDIPSNLVRFSKSALKDSLLGIVLAIVIAIFSGWIMLVVDIVSIALKDKIYWLDDLNLNLEGTNNAETVETAPVEETTVETSENVEE